MLTSLHIRNYALIESLTVQFDRGLNIMTGETGAGKSIIIDALGAVLGERTTSDVVSQGAERSVVEAQFAVSDHRALKRLMAENDVEAFDELILRREISAKGQTRSFINDSPVTTATLKQVGDILVDLHGQHEHQSLLRVQTHIDVLDEFAGLNGAAEEFRQSNSEFQRLLAALDDLRSREQALMERQSLLEFQVREIDAVGPHAGEEEELEAELRILEHAEQLAGTTERVFRSLYEGDNAVRDQLVRARKDLEDLAAIDKSFTDSISEAASAAAIVEELALLVRNYRDKIEYNPARLEEIRNRLGQIALLTKKYGGSLDSVIHHREKIGEELELVKNFDREIAASQETLAARRKISSEIAKRLSSARHAVASTVERSAVNVLAGLGIPKAQFRVVIATRTAADPERAPVAWGKESLAAGSKGVDEVEFSISTNPGQAPKPLVKVASGGEISRIMLALKMILAKSEPLPVLVFDEIDVGISGRIAQAVGQTLKKLSGIHQTIVITHLPQIAGLADAHYVVEKKESGGRSSTAIRKLGFEERVAEVARLLSGEEVTDRGIDNARELMDAHLPARKGR